MTPLAVPAWVRQLGPRRRGWRAPWWPARRGFAFGVAALASVAVFAMGTLGTRRRDGSDAESGYVGTKGAPELRLFIKHGARVAPWDPSVSVVAGDLLRLEVQPDRFPHVSVFEAAGRRDTYVRIYDATIARGRTTALPSSWQVDAQPGDETLIVVLGPGSVAADEIPRLLASDEGGRYWRRRLVITKAATKP
jgi:hypothetical protein